MDTERINFLARKKRTEGLTEEEQAEQKKLYAEYIASITGNLRSQLDNTYVLSPDGKKSKLEKKN